MFGYWPSGEKATAQIDSVWPSSTLRHDPVAACHTRTVLSHEADATSWPSGEKATALTYLIWPSSTLRQLFQSASRFDNELIHPRIWSAKAFRTILASGANIRAEEYICRGASWIICWNRRVNRLASWRNAERALFGAYIVRERSTVLKKGNSLTSTSLESVSSKLIHLFVSPIRLIASSQ